MNKKQINIGCQQNLLHSDKDLSAILEYLCGSANKVFNCSVYYARQIWFKENRFIIPVYGEKPDSWKPSGKRIFIGLYRPGNCTPINADANGAADILRKVAATLELSLKGVSSGALTTPARVHFWAACESPSL